MNIDIENYIAIFCGRFVVKRKILELAKKYI